MYLFFVRSLSHLTLPTKEIQADIQAEMQGMPTLAATGNCHPQRPVRGAIWEKKSNSTE